MFGLDFQTQVPHSIPSANLPTSLKVVHELIETPLKNPSGHGVMVVLRIASEKLGRLAHERQVYQKGTKFGESETAVVLIRATWCPVMGFTNTIIFYLDTKSGLI